MKVLLAEDNEDLREIFSSVLQTAGFQVTACEDGERAFEAYHADRFDIVITDLEMPNMNGASLATNIRQMNDQIPIYVCSGRDLGELNDIFKEAKVNGIFAKGAFQYLADALEFKAEGA